jgi:hypothetical protein
MERLQGPLPRPLGWRKARSVFRKTGPTLTGPTDALLSFPVFHRQDFAKGAERMKLGRAATLAL